MRRRVLPSVLAVLSTAVLATACGGGGGGTSGPKEAALQGIWQWTSGPLVTNMPFGTIRYLQLDATGSGTLINSTPAQALPYCLPVVYAVLGGGRVAFDIPAVGFSDSGATVPASYAYALSGKTLTLTDPSGVATVFTRVDSVPGFAACNATAGGTPVPVPSKYLPDFFRSPLVGDGSADLHWSFLGANGYPAGVVAFDPATQTTSATFSVPPITQYTYLAAEQATDDFWFDCFCGNNDDVNRYTGGSGTSSDNVNTATLGRQIDVRAGGWDGTHLWLAGSDELNVVPGYLEEIDSAAEPDLLLQSIPLDITPSGIAFKGGNVYVLGEYLSAPMVLEFNPSTGALLNHWSLDVLYGTFLPYPSMADAGGTLWAMTAPDPNGKQFFLVPFPGI